MAATVGILSMPLGIALGFLSGRAAYKGEIGPLLPAFCVAWMTGYGLFKAMLDVADYLRGF
jgi:hypothetical protein